MAFILIFYSLYLCNNKVQIIDIWIKATLLWTGLAYFSLEFLSLFSLVSFVPLLIFWCLIDSLALTYIYIQNKCGNNRSKCLKIHLLGILKNNKIWIILSTVLILFALLTIPYNWDSMTYHLSRITNWAQNKSVGHYATNNIRQIVSPMLAEFVNLHVYILSGNKDYLFNLLQCFSALTNIWLIYKIAQKIGCNKHYAHFSAFLFFTCPIAFGEALSTQVDQFASLWLLIFTYHYLDIIEDEYKFQYNTETISKCLIMCGCIAFGYLTKPSVLIGMVFFALLLLPKCIKRKDSIAVIAKLILLGIIFILIILIPELVRNILSFGSISLPIAGQRQLVGTTNPLYILVNGLKNYAFNLPTIYIEHSGEYITAIIFFIAKILGVAIDAPSISEDGREFYLHDARTYGHDIAVNAVIAWCLILCLIWGIYRFRKQTNKKGRFYAISSSIVFLLFCCIVRWEPFVSRYMVSYLALLCPVIAYEVQDFKEHNRHKALCTWPTIFIIFMCCVELIGLCDFHARIAKNVIHERFRGYFRYREYIYDDYKEVCNLVLENPQDVGLLLGSDTYEYPLWQQLGNHIKCIKHIMVENESSQYTDESFVPNYIISSEISLDVIEFNGQPYYLMEECKDNSELWLYYVSAKH